MSNLGQYSREELGITATKTQGVISSSLPNQSVQQMSRQREQRHALPAILECANWAESKHPRDDSGKFAPKNSKKGTSAKKGPEGTSNQKPQKMDCLDEAYSLVHSEIQSIQEAIKKCKTTDDVEILYEYIRGISGHVRFARCAKEYDKLSNQLDKKEDLLYDKADENNTHGKDFYSRKRYAQKRAAKIKSMCKTLLGRWQSHNLRKFKPQEIPSFEKPAPKPRSKPQQTEFVSKWGTGRSSTFQDKFNEAMKSGGYKAGMKVMQEISDDYRKEHKSDSRFNVKGWNEAHQQIDTARWDERKADKWDKTDTVEALENELEANYLYGKINRCEYDQRLDLIFEAHKEGKIKW